MFDLTCTACAWESVDADLSACPVCGATIDIRYPSSDIPVQPELPGIWRYAAHLPLSDISHAVSLGEGGTHRLQHLRVHTQRPGAIQLVEHRVLFTPPVKRRGGTVGVELVHEHDRSQDDHEQGACEPPRRPSREADPPPDHSCPEARPFCRGSHGSLCVRAATGRRG